MCLIGNDVVSLFPSIKSKSTGVIVRKRVEKSPLKFEGFDYKQGLRYIVLNKHYTGDLKGLWNVLPWRRKTGGVTPGMTGNVSDRNEKNVEEQWIFPKREPDEAMKKAIIGRVAEIGVRIVFEHFSYKFGGDIFKQSEGGPIGARVTMAASRLVMQSWSEEYRAILERAGLSVDWLNGFVDDGRQASSVLREGMKFDPEDKDFVYTEEAAKEDRELNESTNARMARLCLPAMNSINSDLVFTVEIPEEFEKRRLPTLDFKIWLMKNFTINHTYFQKSMKTPYLIMNRSAMGDHQRAAILANELIRRLSNVNVDEVDQDEVVEVIEQFTKELKNSEYSHKHSREAVVNGLKGWKGKRKRRVEEGKGFYRPAKSTLKTRVQKKLLEKETWYRGRKRKERDEDDDEEKSETDFEMKRKFKKQKQNPINLKGKIEQKPDVSSIKAAMFVTYTPGSSLAKELRECEYKMENLTGHRIKIVEKSGLKLEDLLTQANPWKGELCERAGCLLCDTKKYTGKNLRQECEKRNLVYETYCITCEEREIERIETETEGDEKMRKSRIEKIKRYKYIGETCRSVYERALEHLSDMEQLKPGSHLLQHILDVHEHEQEDQEEVRFGVKIRQFSKSSFERQILESVLIQQDRHHYLLNSRAEYNRCAVPRLATKIGERDFKKWEKRQEKEKEKEEQLEKNIRNLRKERNRLRRPASKKEQPAGKRRKMEDGKSEQTWQEWGRPEQTTRGEKRGDASERENGPQRKKIRQQDIREAFSSKSKTSWQENRDQSQQKPPTTPHLPAAGAAHTW